MWDETFILGSLLSTDPVKLEVWIWAGKPDTLLREQWDGKEGSFKPVSKLSMGSWEMCWALYCLGTIHYSGSVTQCILGLVPHPLYRVYDRGRGRYGVSFLFVLGRGRVICTLNNLWVSLILWFPAWGLWHLLIPAPHHFVPLGGQWERETLPSE